MTFTRNRERKLEKRNKENTIIKFSSFWYLREIINMLHVSNLSCKNVLTGIRRTVIIFNHYVQRVERALGYFVSLHVELLYRL